MKATKKLVALLLIMTMVFAMGVTSFAAEKTVTVKFNVISSDANAPTNGNTFSLSVDIPQDKVADLKTVKDAVDYAANNNAALSLTWSGSILTTVAYGGTPYGSVFVDMGTNYYLGYDWIYVLNGTEPEVYMDAQDLVDGANVIELKYDLWETVW